MKKIHIASAVLLLATTQLNAQFVKTYELSDPQGTYSMRGYDLSLNNGKYYYTSGDEAKKTIFEINPTDGVIINPSTKVQTFDQTGSTSGIGKNSLAIARYFHDPASQWAAPLNPPDRMYLTGNISNWNNSHSYFHSKEVYDAGSTFSGALITNHNSPNIYQWVANAQYSDQVTLYNNRFMVGNDKYTGELFMFRHHNGIFSDRAIELISGTVSYTDPMYDFPTRTISRDVNSNSYDIITAVGGAVHDGSNYIYDPQKMDPGVWTVDQNLNTTSYKTYHNQNDPVNNNLGVAQSIINVSPLSNTTRNLIVASGNNPNSTVGSIDQFQMGRWDKDHFHLIRDWITNSLVDAWKFNFQAISQTYPLQVEYENVQVGDIVEVSDGYLIVGSFTKKETNLDFPNRIPDYDEKVFMAKVIRPSNIFLPLTVGYAKYFNSVQFHNEIQANRIKILNNEVFIVGSATSIISHKRIPFLIKTDLTNQLEECSTAILMVQETVNITEVQAPIQASNSIPYLGPGYADNGLQINAFEALTCVNPPHERKKAIRNSIEDASQTQLSILPNPAQNQVRISGLSESVATITVLDVSGKLVRDYTQEVNSNHTLDISELNTGIYILRISQADQVHTLKLIKE
ncbi:MAG: T9SS type A sorting domain-containing protein [Flavobacteriales bacterium]|nr:T9SS type A sorting domain-containing protein [Flavobacteriales bacterium]